MAEHMNLYQRAVYYDVIFDRDVGKEVDFLAGVYQRYAGRDGPGSVLDIACGPGYHSRAFARRGVRAAGLDLGHEMLKLAHEKAAADGVEVEWIEGDMRAIDLAEPVDLAFIMFDGIDALLTTQDLTRHFRAVAANLTPDGVYLIDLTHPRDCSFQDYGTFRYAGERDGVSVEIVWATNNPKFDLVTGVAHVELKMIVNENGRRTEVTDSADERLLLPQELALLAQDAGGLEVAGWHGAYDVEQPLDYTPASRRMIAVLRKTA